MPDGEGWKHIHILVREDFKARLLKVLPDRGMLSSVCRRFLALYVEARELDRRGAFDKAAREAIDKDKEI